MYEELVKRLRERAAWINFPHHGEECPIEDAMLMMQAADAIEELSREIDIDNAALTEIDAAIPRWIPVTERLPEEAKEVLALDNNGDFCIAWVIEFVGSKGTYSEWACADGWSDTQLPITHWMPLPEPPKEET